VAWARNDWTANVFATRYGSVPNWQETGRIAPYILWNVNATKRITEQASVGLYVNNLLNKFAPRDDGFNSYPYFWRAFSPIGREVSVQFTYALD
jgi:outer membrane receptor protein involved in Fe transport